MKGNLEKGKKEEMEIKEISKKGKAGRFSSEIKKATIDGIEIDNYSERKIYEDGELIETIAERRKLPEKVRPPFIVPPPVAEAKLLFIDHKNPFWILSPEVKRDITCWVQHTDEGETFLYDAVTGKEIGKGVPAPTDKAISLSGYCAGYDDPWGPWRANAASWFNHWGFSTWSVYAPSKASIGAGVSNSEYKNYYALAHGGSTEFQTQSNVWVSSADVASWMGSSGGDGGDGGGPIIRPTPAPSGRSPMWFAFLGHCQGMAGTGSGTFSHAFRKGQMINTVTIGYYNAHTNPDGWASSLNWQKQLFAKMNTGVTWKTAFDYASAVYPECLSMMRFVGDTNMKLRPAGGEEEVMSLNIQSDPSGKSIIVDGTNVGITPKVITVTCAGDHTIKVVCGSSGGGGGGGGPPHR